MGYFCLDNKITHRLKLSYSRERRTNNFGEQKMKTYKIYNDEQQEAIFAGSLNELKTLVEITDEQIKSLFYQGIVKFNGLTVIAY